MAGLGKLLLAVCTVAVLPVGPVWAEPIADRGELVFRMAGCENCHTDREHGGARLAGGRKLATPLGTFYTPNITPDPTTGIGRWSEADFRRALREGVGPDGRQYYPSFPYTSYARMSDADIQALWTYLHAQPAVVKANKSHELPWYLNFRPLLVIWKWLFFSPGAYQPEAGKSASWNRGAYLVQGAGHCAECHTPRNQLGGFKKGMELAGSLNGPDGLVVPNITPDRQYGIGSWSKSDLADYLGTGNRPDGDCAGSLMAELIDNGLKYLPKTDLEAIADYVTSVPASSNPARKAGKAGGKKRQQEDY
ncbi:c-type cytochrome [Parasulfuritortus cantonensis]|uniref:C-type cytochrome n=2 Tax=Parasulfuritortus cantonensis TaxID=2528202 RepID=A0A4R1BLT0_9PROT|nr:c-type cytochrome [Parasulfuritortus cantonensis]